MIVALVKPQPDLSNVSVSRGQGRVFERGKRRIGPDGERAAAAAVKAGGEVAAVAFGTADDADVLRKALAVGAARGVLVAHPKAREFDSAAVARVLAAAVRRLGATAVYGGGPEIPSRVAAELGDAIPVTIVGERDVQPPALNAMQIMKAAKKPVETWNAEDLGVDLAPVARVVGTSLRPDLAAAQSGDELA